jgi:hypothetical protein
LFILPVVLAGATPCSMYICSWCRYWGPCRCAVNHSKDPTQSEVRSKCKCVWVFAVRSMFFESRAPVRPPGCSSARGCVNPPFFSRTVVRLRAYHCSPATRQHINICAMLVNCSGSSTTIS